MVICTSCGKTIEKIPTWMEGTKVDFVCNNCPNRQTKNIAFVQLEAVVHPSAKLTDDVAAEVADEEEED